MSSADTIVALATPHGTSALAVVRASGPLVRELVIAVFGQQPSARVARYADFRTVNGDLVDDVVYTYFEGPRSYTGEDLLEISTHGNPLIAQKILVDLVARDARLAEPGEFTKRAFLNGRLDLSQAEAVMDLIIARSERALAAANQQLRGALSRAVEDLIQRTVNCLAQVEAYIDFPDEDLPAENQRELLAEIERIERGTDRLLATNRYGEMLRGGIRTVIVGEPNVGKSSLLNRLVGHERALVSPEPGTTRDYLEEMLPLGPHSLRLIDTAGLNASPTSLERRGIEKTFEQVRAADLYLWVVDGSRSLPPLPDQLNDRLTAHNTVLVLNKSDLARVASDASDIWESFARVNVSALRGDGIDELIAVVTRMVDAFQGEVGDEFIAVNARHATGLSDARVALLNARRNIQLKQPSELVASELRAALTALGEITGKIDNERVLDALFATFCIGK